MKRSRSRHRIANGLLPACAAELHPAELPEGTTDPYPTLTALLMRIGRHEPAPPDQGRLLEIASSLGLTRKVKGELVLTRKGARMLEDPRGSWRLFPVTLLGGNPYHRLAGEILFALLIQGDTTLGEVIATIRRAATEANYREAGTGEPPGEVSLMKALDPTVLPVGEMGLFTPGDFNVSMGFTPVGKAVALEALRHRATSPPAAPWD